MIRSAIPNEKIIINADLPMTYLHQQKGKGKPVLIFLHGYTDNGPSLLRRCFSESDDRFEVLAPNGLFPTPLKAGNGWKEAYSWYFIDFDTNTVIVPADIAVKAIQELIEKLDLVDRDKIVVGFSQGGFLVPKLLPVLKNVKKVIGIGCGYRVGEYPDSPHFTVDAIHGDADAIVPYQRAFDSYKTLLEKKISGNFVSIKGLAHTMNDEARAVFKKMISEIF